MNGGPMARDSSRVFRVGRVSAGFCFLDWQVPDPHQILNGMSCAVPFLYTRLTPHPFRYSTLPKGGDPAPLCDSTAHQPREPGAWLWDLNKQFGSFNHSGHELC